MPFAKIVDGVVTQIIPVLEGAVHPALHDEYTDISPEVEVGMITEDGETFTQPPEVEGPEVEQPDPAAPVYAPLSMSDFIALVEAVASLTPDQVMDIMEDNQTAVVRRVRLELKMLDGKIPRDDPKVHGGLHALAASVEYFEAAHVDAVLEAWPTV